MPTEQPLPASHNPCSAFSLLVTLVGLAGIAALILPFAGNASPLAVVGAMFSDDFLLKELWREGLPSLLAVFVAAGATRWAISGHLSRGELLVAYLAALVAACCFLSVYAPVGYSLVTGHGDTADRPYDVVNGASIPLGLYEWLIFVFPWLGLMAGAYLLRRNARIGVPAAANALAAMQCVYVVVAIFCLASFRSVGWQFGAYLVAVTTLAYLAQMIAVTVAVSGHAAALEPK